MVLQTGIIMSCSAGVAPYLSVPLPVDVDRRWGHHSRVLDLPGMGAVLENPVIITDRGHKDREPSGPLVESVIDGDITQQQNGHNGIEFFNGS